MQPVEQQRVLNITDSVMDMSYALNYCTPDHVHWLKKDQPWFLRFIPEFISEEFPFTDKLVLKAYNLFFKRKGLAVEADYPGITVLNVAPNLTASQRKALLFFREIDFRLASTDFNSTRIEGDRNMYHFFSPWSDERLSETLAKRRLTLLDEEKLAVFTEARML